MGDLTGTLITTCDKFDAIYKDFQSRSKPKDDSKKARKSK